MLRNAVNWHDVRQVDFGRSGARQLNLRFLSCIFQALQRHGILRQVKAAVLTLELFDEPINDDLVKVVTAQVRIAVSRQHFENAVTELEDGHVMRSTAQVKHDNLLVGCFLVETVSERCRSRLVDDPLHFKPRDFACLFCGLALRVVEVGRNSDHRTCHFMSEVILGGFLHFLERHRADLLRRVQAIVNFHPRGVVVATHNLVRDARNFRLHLVERTAHEALDRIDRLLGVRDGLTLGRLADFALSAFHKGDDRRRGALAFRVVDDHGLVAFHDRDAAVGGPEVDSDNLAHMVFLNGY